MEPRITTLLDQSPYRKFTLDPSVLISSSSVAARHNEPASGVDEAHSNRDLWGHNDHVESRVKASSQTHSGAPLARVLNDPATSSQSYQHTSGRQTPQHAAFHIRNDDAGVGSAATSPDARRRDEAHNAAGISVSDVSLIQLPKPPQVPRKTAKRPRIPPLLQGLHQPPPLPPKNRLFPPITSDRSGLVSDVGDRFSLGNAYAASSTEELAQARVPHHKEYDVKPHDTRQLAVVHRTQNEPSEFLEPAAGPGVEPPLVTPTPSRAPGQSKAPRKRKWWSQKETEDLLTGVSRFGIGRWKQILGCKDFHFQGRTSVDLKDRFRVCRPGEGLKPRKVAASKESANAISGGSAQRNSGPSTSALTGNAQEFSVLPVQRRASEEPGVQDANGQATVDKTEVYGPFLKSNRRARREFSDTDDKNLLKGFKRHGPVWRALRDDFELGFGMRHPTDLRDRFRTRYPDLFAQAGFKLKAKGERALKAKAGENKAKTPDQPDKPSTQTIACTTPKAAPVTTASQLDPTRPTFDLLTFDDSDDSPSPIILNRNILQWADSNPSLPTSHPPSDTLHHPLPATDGLHINPLFTLKLPCTPWSATAPALPPLKPGVATGTASASTAGTPGASIGASSTNMASSANRALDRRTPNLPNIVFPYVPRRSARGAVLNLPAPADILSERGEGEAWAGGG
ncbi:hypothetical protein EJ07DRAFT_150258 [Lizonia empirigonia]|nr:hypothetical protein EJ07DRAFT_150258 [Lizonia empirigonia]